MVRLGLVRRHGVWLVNFSPSFYDCEAGCFKQPQTVSLVKVSTQKKIRDYLGIFLNIMGGFPNSQNLKPKKCPFITLKSPRKHTKMFTKPPISFNKGFPKEGMRGGGEVWEKFSKQSQFSSNTVLAAPIV